MELLEREFIYRFQKFFEVELQLFKSIIGEIVFFQKFFEFIKLNLNTFLYILRFYSPKFKIEKINTLN